MEKFFKWLYYYCLALFTAFVVYMCLVLIFSPRTDALKRGFIPCTENLVMQLSECKRGSIGCTLRNLWQDTKCNVYVVLDGFGAWVKNKQKTPWENYLFEPVAFSASDEDLAQYSDFEKHTKELQQQYYKLEKDLQLEEKNTEKALNLDSNLLQEGSVDEKKEYDWEISEESIDNNGDITDEAFVDEISSFIPGDKPKIQIERPNIVLKLQKITEEKLHEEGLIDEKDK